MPTRIQETSAGAGATIFAWDSPAGLTPVSGPTPGGFAIVASGLVLDASATNKRALFFVNVDVNPWTVQASLSR